MKTQSFTLEQRKAPSAAKRKAVAKSMPTPDDSKTAWGREVLKRIEALHKALDGKKLA